MQIAICDDEKEIRKSLGSKVQKLYPEAEIVFYVTTILIFVTAIEEYVFQAFDVGAFHYIVKPFCDEKLKTVLQKAVDQYCKTMGSR